MTERESPTTPEIDRLLESLKEMSPEERVRFLISDLSPKPIAEADKVYFENKAADGNADGLYTYGLFFLSRKGIAYLRTHKEKSVLGAGVPIDATHTSMESEGARIGSTLVRKGRLYIGANDIIDMTFKTVEDNTDELIQEVFRTHFDGYTMLIARKK